MATQTVIGSGSTKNNGGTVLLGGTIASSIWTNVTYSQNSFLMETPTRLIPAGTAHMVKPYSAGVYGAMEKGYYVARIIGSRISQVDNSAMRLTGSSFFRFPIKPSEGARRLHITAFNALTGAVTKGGSAGNLYSYTAIDSGSVIDQAAHPSRSVPGELVYLVTGQTPSMIDYAAITNI